MKYHGLVRVLYLLPATGLGLALFNVWIPYSYWADELGSVSMSTLPLNEVLISIAGDVHPPLFQLLLKGWVWCFGTDEPLVRSFSLLCCISALAYFVSQTRLLSSPARWAAISIFATCSSFSFYSQEARSYGLTLLLATILTLIYVRHSSNRNLKCTYRLAFFAALLSLTHYFGLLLSLTILTLSAVESWQAERTRNILISTLALCCAWPTVHAVLGLAKLKTSKNGWMVVDGPLDSARILYRTFLPNVPDVYLLMFVLSFLSLIAHTIFVVQRNREIDGSSWPQTFKLTALFAVMWLGVSCIDMISPISTERNFIVLLPTFALLVAHCLQVAVGQNKIVVSILVMFGVALSSINGLFFSHYLLALKWTPQQNWRETAQFLVSNHKFEHLYYLRSRDDEETERVFNFYVKKLSKGTLALERIYISQIPEIKMPSMLVLGGVGQPTFDEVKKLSRGSKLKIFQPSQSLIGTTGVVILSD